jgi:hypothetical protein
MVAKELVMFVAIALLFFGAKIQTGGGWGKDRKKPDALHRAFFLTVESITKLLRAYCFQHHI